MKLVRAQFKRNSGGFCSSYSRL